MRIAADNGHSRLRYPQFWTDDVDDSMVCRAQVMQFDTVPRTILTKLFYLHAGKLVLDCLVLVYCRYIMIWSGNGAVRVFHANPSFLQIQKSYR